jgi:mannose-6-phosphate isomerase
MDKLLYPLLLQPSLHTKVWGGRNLQTVMNKDLPTDEPYGESWELHDTSTVENGLYAGKTIQELLQELGADLVGQNNDPN